MEAANHLGDYFQVGTVTFGPGMHPKLNLATSLPGMPLWLSALYFPAFKPINMWWTPAMWSDAIETLPMPLVLTLLSGTSRACW
jgi:hypothetical protein